MRGWIAGLVAGMVAVALTACGPADVPAPPAEKRGTGELRTDPEPLTERFPVLGAPTEVRWMSGRYGDDRVPGPSTYWIDAVITLDPAQVDELTSAYIPEATTVTPTVVEGLRGHLPPGPFLAGAELDAAFTQGRWWASAFLDPQVHQLVLVATGE